MVSDRKAIGFSGFAEQYVTGAASRGKLETLMQPSSGVIDEA
jgi:hypothetical protein